MGKNNHKKFDKKKFIQLCHYLCHAEEKIEADLTYTEITEMLYTYLLHNQFFNEHPKLINSFEKFADDINCIAVKDIMFIEIKFDEFIHG